MNRRTFLQTLGLATAALALPEPRRKLWAVPRNAPYPDRQPWWVGAADYTIKDGARGGCHVVELLKPNPNRVTVVDVEDGKLTFDPPLQLEGRSHVKILRVDEPELLHTGEFTMEDLRALARPLGPGGLRDFQRHAYVLPPGVTITDEMLEDWNNTAGEEPLHNALGLSWEQYARWVERG